MDQIDNISSEDIYKEHILELSKSDKYMNHNDDLSDYDRVIYSNTSCGDIVTLYIKLSESKIIDIKVNVDGCVISKASTNLLVSRIIGSDISEVYKLMPYDMHNMLGVKVSELRAPCVLMGLNAMHKYLDGKI